MEKNNSNAENLNIETLKEKAKHIDQMLQDVSDSSMLHNERSNNSSRRRSHQPPNFQAEQRLNWNNSQIDEIFERSVKISRGESVAPFTATKAGSTQTAKEGLTEEAAKKTAELHDESSALDNVIDGNESTLNRMKVRKASLKETEKSEANSIIPSLKSFNSEKKFDEIKEPEERRCEIEPEKRMAPLERNIIIPEKKKRTPIHLEPVTINWAKWTASEGYVYQEEESAVLNEAEKPEMISESTEEIFADGQEANPKETENITPEPEPEVFLADEDNPEEIAPIGETAGLIYEDRAVGVSDESEIKTDDNLQVIKALSSEEKLSLFKTLKSMVQTSEEDANPEQNNKEEPSFFEKEKITGSEDETLIEEKLVKSDEVPSWLEEENIEEEEILIEEEAVISTEPAWFEEEKIADSEEEILFEEEAIIQAEAPVWFEEENIEESEEEILFEEEAVIQAEAPVWFEEEKIADSEEETLFEEEAVIQAEAPVWFEEEKIADSEEEILLEEEAVIQAEAPVWFEEENIEESDDEILFKEQVIYPTEMAEQAKEDNSSSENENTILTQEKNFTASSDLFTEVTPVVFVDTMEKIELQEDDHFSDVELCWEQTDSLSDDYQIEQNADDAESIIFDQKNVVQGTDSDEALLAFFGEGSSLSEDGQEAFENHQETIIEDDSLRQNKKSVDEIVDTSPVRKPVFAGLQAFKKPSSPAGAAVILNDKEDEYTSNQDVPEKENPVALNAQFEDTVCFEEELMVDTVAAADQVMHLEWEREGKNFDAAEEVNVHSAIQNLDAENFYFDEEFDFIPASNATNINSEKNIEGSADLFQDVDEPDLKLSSIKTEDFQIPADTVAYESGSTDDSAYFEEEYFGESSVGTTSRWLAMDEFFRISNEEEVIPSVLEPDFSENAKQGSKLPIKSIEDPIAMDVVFSEEIIDTNEEPDSILTDELNGCDVNTIPAYEEKSPDISDDFLVNEPTEKKGTNCGEDDFVSVSFEPGAPLFEDVTQEVLIESKIESDADNQAEVFSEVEPEEKPEAMIFQEDLIGADPVFEEELLSDAAADLFTEELIETDPEIEGDRFSEASDLLFEEELPVISKPIFEEEIRPEVTTDTLFTEASTGADLFFEEIIVEQKAKEHAFSRDLIGSDPVFEEEIIE